MSRICMGSCQTDGDAFLLPLCRRLLSSAPIPPADTATAQSPLWLCPRCQGPMAIVEFLTADPIFPEACRRAAVIDIS